MRCQVKAVLLALADRCDDEGFDAWPSVATIAAETELHHRTVQRCLRQLETAALIAEQDKPRQYRPRTWMVNLDAVTDLSEVNVATPLANPDVSTHTPLMPTRGVSPDTAAPFGAGSGVTIPAAGVTVQAAGVTTQTLRGDCLPPDPVLNRPKNNPLNGETQASRAVAVLSDKERKALTQQVKEIADNEAKTAPSETYDELVARVQQRSGCRDGGIVGAAVALALCRLPRRQQLSRISSRTTSETAAEEFVQLKAATA